MHYLITTTAQTADAGTIAATLHAARAAAFAACCQSVWHPAEQFNRQHECQLIPESGATIGPLPDGTMVTVRPIDMTDWQGYDIDDPADVAIILADFAGTR